MPFICFLLLFSRLGDSEPKLGEKLNLAIEEEANKHGDLLVGVFVFVFVFVWQIQYTVD